jgi:2-oxoglutarate ferredoxin oxidoreductase subunit alpha
VPEVFLFNQVKKRFKPKTAAKVIKAIKEGYKLTEPKERIKKNGKPNYFISGSEAVGVGAVNGGIDVYIAYPMTPSTPVLHYLARAQYDNNFLTVQMENEIGVINSALGASFVGAKSMVGTSGGGFALMNEALSLAGISEIPLVVYLCQRPGPATGIPTYTAQADLKFAVNAGHGEFPRIIVAPGDPQEAIVRTQEAFYLASKYRALATIVTDKHLAESNYTHNKLDKSQLKLNRFILEKAPKNYKSYRLTRTGTAARAVPGQGPIVRANSYEHDEYGNTTEEPEWSVKMTDKRLRKIEYIKKEISKLKPVAVHGKGKNLLIGWGSTKGAIVDALAEMKGFRYLQISYINPFPKQEVKKEIKKAGRVILIENNATGQLGDIITEQTGYEIKEKILKYDGRPFVTKDIINSIKK